MYAKILAQAAQEAAQEILKQLVPELCCARDTVAIWKVNGVAVSANLKEAGNGG